MNNKWIIELVILHAVVVVFAACKGNESEETTTQPTTESTTASAGDNSSNDIEVIPGDELILNDEAFTDGNAIIIGGGDANSSEEDSISWDEIKGKKS